MVSRVLRVWRSGKLGRFNGWNEQLPPVTPSGIREGCRSVVAGPAWKQHRLGFLVFSDLSTSTGRNRLGFSNLSTSTERNTLSTGIEIRRLDEQSRSTTVAAEVIYHAKKWLMLKMAFKAAGLLFTGVLLALAADPPVYFCWKLSRPNLLAGEKHAVHVDASDGEDRLVRLMNEPPKFVLLYGLPGTGKTSTILAAARKRGSGVIYRSTEGYATLEPLMKRLEREYGLVIPSFRELVLRQPSGMSFWERLGEGCKLWTRLFGSRGNPATSPIIIVDNVHRLTKEELHHLACIGKTASDNDQFGLWLVSSEECGVQLFAEQSGAKAVILNPFPEAALVEMATRALGSQIPGAHQLAEHLVYMTGSALGSLWNILSGFNNTADVEEITTTFITNLDRYSVAQRKLASPAEKLFLERVLASGREAVVKTEPVKNWSCLRPEAGVKVSVRSEHCRDVIKAWLASYEADEAIATALEEEQKADEARKATIEAGKKLQGAEASLLAAEEALQKTEKELQGLEYQADKFELKVRSYWYGRESDEVKLERRNFKTRKDTETLVRDKLKQTRDKLVIARDGRAAAVEQARLSEVDAIPSCNKAFEARDRAIQAKDEALKVISERHRVIRDAAWTYLGNLKREKLEESEWKT